MFTPSFDYSTARAEPAYPFSVKLETRGQIMNWPCQNREIAEQIAEDFADVDTVRTIMDERGEVVAQYSGEFCDTVFSVHFVD